MVGSTPFGWRGRGEWMDDGGANERTVAAASKEDSRCISGGGNSLFSIELLYTFQKQMFSIFLDT